MIIERDLLISLLKLTKNGAIAEEIVYKDAKIPIVIGSNLLQKLQKNVAVYLHNGLVEIDNVGRLKIAVKAVELGVDIERLSEVLGWQEFESIAAITLERYGYDVVTNLRFKHERKRWEIDVVGCRKPFVICIDCKHWRHGISTSVLTKIVELQVDRVKALTEILPDKSIKLECSTWSKAQLFPVILSLVSNKFKFHNNVPVVPVLQLQNFLSQMIGYMDSLNFFTKEISHL